jgi:hypothetical protein
VYEDIAKQMTKGCSICLNAILFLLLLPTLARGAQEVVPRVVPPPARVVLRVRRTAVPIKLFGDRLIVRVRIDGNGPLEFALGTDTTGTLLDTQLAHELGLSHMGQAPIAQPRAAAAAGAAVSLIDELELGGAEVSGLSAVSADLSKMGTASQAFQSLQGIHRRCMLLGNSRVCNSSVSTLGLPSGP